jgi:flagellar motor switch protein FliN/FliY
METDMGKNSTGSGTDQNVINESTMAHQGVQDMKNSETRQGETGAGKTASLNKQADIPMQANLDFVLDIPMMLTVELGRSQMLINELLKLGRGSVIELAKLAGEPLDILANQRLIARGEVVVVNEKYGIRITEIISPAERVERLR